MNKLMMMAMVAAMGVAGPTLADTTIGYSGQLRDATGGALPESQRNPTITFRLYSNPTGGSALWGVSKKVVLNSEGLFSTSLSDSDAKTGENAKQLQQVLEENATLYIGLSPNGNEIKPRQQILETPRAAVATKATTGSDGFTVSGTATITTIQVDDKVMQKSKDANANIGYYELLPRGVIVLWYGAAKDVPKGWAICNGRKHTDLNGKEIQTPDLRGKIIFAASYDKGGTDEQEGGTHCERLSAFRLSMLPSDPPVGGTALCVAYCYIMKL